jgi:hypothetical protein
LNAFLAIPKDTKLSLAKKVQNSYAEMHSVNKMKHAAKELRGKKDWKLKSQLRMDTSSFSTQFSFDMKIESLKGENSHKE